jgi:hypothetical protein
VTRNVKIHKLIIFHLCGIRDQNHRDYISVIIEPHTGLLNLPKNVVW